MIYCSIIPKEIDEQMMIDWIVLECFFGSNIDAYIVHYFLLGEKKNQIDFFSIKPETIFESRIPRYQVKSVLYSHNSIPQKLDILFFFIPHQPPPLLTA